METKDNNEAALLTSLFNIIPTFSQRFTHITISHLQLITPLIQTWGSQDPRDLTISTKAEGIPS